MTKHFKSKITLQKFSLNINKTKNPEDKSKINFKYLSALPSGTKIITDIELKSRFN
jgi:hypothetical protein